MFSKSSRENIAVVFFLIKSWCQNAFKHISLKFGRKGKSLGSRVIRRQLY